MKKKRWEGWRWTWRNSDAGLRIKEDISYVFIIVLLINISLDYFI
jgi:hypothetical protein